jgi:hypothetical protein
MNSLKSHKGSENMDNLVNNSYIGRHKLSYKIIDMRILKENLIDYRNWLIKTNRADQIKNYEKFLKAKCLY